MSRKQKSPPKPIDRVDAIPRKGVATFVALVDPSGGGGGARSGRQRNWTFTARLFAWRGNGGPVVREPIIVVDSGISELTLTNRMKQFTKWRIVKLTARHKTRGTWLHPIVEIEKFLGAAEDQQLDAIRQSLQEPVTIKDRVFGDVTLEREAGWFLSTKFIPSEGLNIFFNAETVDDARRLIDAAKPFWRNRRRWYKEFQEIVVEKWFPDRAGMYLNEYGFELTKRGFLKLLGTPCAVTFWQAEGDLGFEIGGWSDELFSDHGVQVQGTLWGGLERSTY